MVLALIDHVQPTHFITLSLCQGRMIVSEHGKQTYVKGDDTIYQQAHASFMRALSKRFASRSQWPDHVEEEEFRRTICGIAYGHPWIMNGEYAVDIQNLAHSRDALNTAFYSVKRGLDRICL